MIVNFDYKPLDIHRPFHASSAQYKAIVGGFGSGKSYALCAENIAFCLENPGAKTILARKNIPALRDTTETAFFEILPLDLYKAGTVKRAGGHYESFTFPNGSTTLFRGMEDWTKHKSINVAWIGFDEADELNLETVEGMASRLRQRDPTKEALALGITTKIERRQMCFAFNPAGHDFLYKMFVDPKTAKKGTEWFRSTSFDNPFLPVDFLDNLMTMPEAWLRRYVFCQFDQFGGQIYDEWDPQRHIIDPPSEGWGNHAVYWFALDPGLRSPTAGVFAVVDKAKGRLVAVAEHQERGLAADQHAKALRVLMAKHKIQTVSWKVADPAIMRRDLATNTSLSDTYRRLGWKFNLGPREHKIRIPALGQLIHRDKFVITKECPQLGEQIQNYRWEDVTPQQKLKGVEPERVLKVDDHLVDCAQYLSSKWVKPFAGERPPDTRSPELVYADEVRSTIKKQLAANARNKIGAPGVIY